MLNLAKYTEVQISDLYDAEQVQFVIAQYGEHDAVAINEDFHVWKDIIHQDGNMSDHQVNQFTYVGKYS